MASPPRRVARCFQDVLCSTYAFCSIANLIVCGTVYGRPHDSAQLLRGFEHGRQQFIQQCGSRQNPYRQSNLYPDRFNGHETASGDTFHQSDHTAASNKLPLGTMAKVTNLKTGKSTDVTVTDRGRALGSRKIDLTKKAARTSASLRRKESHGHNQGDFLVR